MTSGQIAALAAGKTVALTSQQSDALTRAWGKDMKRCLGWFLGWFFSLSEPLWPWLAPS